MQSFVTVVCQSIICCFQHFKPLFFNTWRCFVSHVICLCWLSIWAILSATIHVFGFYSDSFGAHHSLSMKPKPHSPVLTVRSHRRRRESQSGRKSFIFNVSQRQAPVRAARRVLNDESVEESSNHVNFMVMSYDAVWRQPIGMLKLYFSAGMLLISSKQHRFDQLH